ncbi:TonB-dependent receptor domain-containing protein [Campylobacter sp. RM16187]|uniref:TonB-dependent receptor domain-containing protein n=1 Tax=Campylobacter sp. RM16187 TaxID=1660063 RepID=UPI0021B5659C|nr:TonB-dependent receptor [Campylobacter sp. RM16187]QKG28403.1 TonB-dependent heme/hemoglobin receptor family protein [Campylobacter sp. RM16187]
MHKFSKMAAIVLFGASISMLQGADTKSSAKRMDANSTAATAQLDMVSVTANRSETDVAKYAGQVSILTQDNLSKSPSIIENLGQISGIQLGDDLGRQIAQSYNIRGFDDRSNNRVIIEQDNIRRSPTMFSNLISSFRVDNDLLKRAEVVKGASSVLHGSGAIGGIISMQTKSVDDFIIGDKNYGVMIGHRQESNHMNSNRGALAFKPVENLGFLLYGKHADFGNTKFADKGNGETYALDDERINTLFGKIEWDITDEHELDFSVFNYHENLVTGWQSLWHNVDTVSGVLKQRDYNVVYRYSPINNPWINFSAQYFNSYAKYHRVMTNPTRVVNYKNEDRRWGVGVKNESMFNTGFLEHRLVIGLDHEHRKEDAVYRANGVLSDFGSFPNFYKDYGLYIQDIINIGNLEFTLGGRYDYFKRGVKLSGREAYSDKRFSPKIGLAYEVFDGINLLAGYAETFRGPTPNETSAQGPLNIHYYYLPNNGLRPEIAKEYELGFSIDKENLIGNDRLYFKATYFNGSINNMINLKEHPEMGTPPASPMYARYENVDSAKRNGYEIEARYNINNFAFNTAYDHIKVYDKQTKKRVNVYADKILLGGQYTYTPWNLTLGANMSHWLKPSRDTKSFVSRGKKYYYVDKSFTIVNLKGKWTPTNFENKIFGRGFSLSFGINNIFDKQYIHPRRHTETTLVGKGRNFYVDFEKKF